MEPKIPVLDYQKTLTNSTAESIETRSRDEVLPHLGDSPREIKSLQDRSEFMNELDRFAPKGVAFE